jgi:ATP-dependent Clp protease ATP-binding subunit ClpX
LLRNKQAASLLFQEDVIIVFNMSGSKENIPTPKELEKEIGEFLTKRFGNNVKFAQPIGRIHPAATDEGDAALSTDSSIKFDLKPEELISYLDHYIIKQDQAKAVLATKICTHFNRVKRFQSNETDAFNMTGHIKNNVLMIGPTGVGKTYMVKLIAQKIGVPFVKGDATKFSETGYVGGDVEDLVRDLVREAGGDIERAQYGIIYIDEIDKIASSRNIIGADVSRTGVQRALLKPMEETEVDLKVPHDPISMLQEVEQFRKTGKRDRAGLNTRHILFIMSGAFQELSDIISKRMTSSSIGFGVPYQKKKEKNDWFKHVQSEDLITFGFESEFVGRLPVRALFEKLLEKDLYDILKNPNNPVILGKKLDFAAYDIDIKFEDELLRIFAKAAQLENTGARGLVSAVEKVMLPYEKSLPSLNTNKFPATSTVTENAKEVLRKVRDGEMNERWDSQFNELATAEKAYIACYLNDNWATYENRFRLAPTPARINAIAASYTRRVSNIESAIARVESFYDEIKEVELKFFKKNEINIVLEEETIDYLIEQIVDEHMSTDGIYQQMAETLAHGLRLILEKTGKNRFFISKEALLNPAAYLDDLIRNELKHLEQNKGTPH